MITERPGLSPAPRSPCSGSACWPTASHRAPETVRAATVAEAAAAAGVDFGGHVTAALNGDQITRDGQTPLATGDTVFFLSADAGG